jgi:hypothetical protein
VFRVGTEAAPMHLNRMSFASRSIPAGAVSLALLLGGCAAPAPTRSRPQLTPAVSDIAERCRTLEEVDLSRIAKGSADWSAFDRFHAKARAGLPEPAADPGAVQLRLAIPGGSFQAPYGISVWAVRERDGVWRVSHVRYLQLPPPPAPPGAPPVQQPPERVVTSGRLNEATAALVDAALASDCLGREPLTVQLTLPMKTGSDLMCPPDAAGGNALDIRERGSVRRYLRSCGRTWASGAIIIALENSRNIVQT